MKKIGSIFKYYHNFEKIYKKPAIELNMGIVAVKVKILPVSLGTNLEKIKIKAKKIVEQSNGKNCQFEEELIAFGLRAIIAFFAWPEEEPLEPLEESLKSIKDVSSIQVIDMRRAIG